MPLDPSTEESHTGAPDGSSVHDAIHEALLDQQEFGVAVCDRDGVLTKMNLRMEQIVGRRIRHARMNQWPDCFHLYDADGRTPLESGLDPLARALRGERVLDALASVRPPRGRTRFVRCNAAPLRGSTGSVFGAVVFVADVTAQVAAQVAARRELYALRDQLIEIVNHELRTPLAVMVGHLELLGELDLDLSIEARWSLDALKRGTARLHGVIETITDQADVAMAATVPQPDDLPNVAAPSAPSVEAPSGWEGCDG